MGDMIEIKYFLKKIHCVNLSDVDDLWYSSLLILGRLNPHEPVAKLDPRLVFKPKHKGNIRV